MDKKRTLITSAAVAGVMLAGATAVAANVGILNSADSSSVGGLSAVADVVTTQAAPTTGIEPQVVDVYIEDPAPATTVVSFAEAMSTTEDVQTYEVDVAGTVAVRRTTSGIALGDVVAADGWTWTAAQSEANAFTVQFENGSRRFVFAAELGADGSIVAHVEEPVTQVVVQTAAPRATTAAAPPVAAAPAVAAPSPTVAAPTYDDHESDDHDDHESDDHDDHESDDHSYEGGGDDD